VKAKVEREIGSCIVFYDRGVCELEITLFSGEKGIVKKIVGRAK